MSNTLVLFKGNYYEYMVVEDTEQCGLNIGGYKSAWLSNAVKSFLMESSKSLFEDVIFAGFYRDGGLVVMKNKMTTRQLLEWRHEF